MITLFVTIFGILIGHDLSMRILYRFHGWLIFARVIALFMFVWPYVRPHILCTQLVIYLLSHFIHIWYLGWPWSEHAHISCVHKMCGRTYGQTNIKRAITLTKINHPWNWYSMCMLRSCPPKIPNMNKNATKDKWLVAYIRPHILCTQLVIYLLLHFIPIWYLGWPWSEHVHIIPISRMVDFCEIYSP
jgi:hypothetical protein